MLAHARSAVDPLVGRPWREVPVGRVPEPLAEDPHARVCRGRPGRVVGAWLGELLCIGYDLWNSPFFPQAGVAPQPAGWAGWWVAGGAALGAVGGGVASALLVAVWRLARGSKPGV